MSVVPACGFANFRKARLRSYGFFICISQRARPKVPNEFRDFSPGNKSTRDEIGETLPGCRAS